MYKGGTWGVLIMFGEGRKLQGPNVWDGKYNLVLGIRSNTKMTKT
jgi:hypothetical protein